MSIVNRYPHVDDNAATSHTIAITTPPAVGKLLFLACAIDKDGGTVTITEAGWSIPVVTKSGNQSTLVTSHKTAVGDETSITINCANQDFSGEVYELSEDTAGVVSTPQDSGGGNTNTLSTGTTPTTSQADTFAIGVWSVDTGSNVQNDRQYTQGFAEENFLIVGSSPGYISASKTLTATDTVECTFSAQVGGSDAMCGSMHVFYTAAASGLTLDSAPVTIAKAETGVQFVVSTPATVPTSGNTTVINSGDALTVTSVTGSDPYTINCTVPIDITKQAGDPIPGVTRDYAWTITVDAENVVSSSIPLTVQSGWTNIVLASPLTTVGYMLNGFTGDTPVTSDTMEFEAAADLSPGLDSEWIWDVAPTVTQVVARRVIQIDGTVGATANVTFIVSDAVAPILTLPTGTKTDYESGTGTVTTDEGNGTLFFYASTNVSETLATIKASGSSQGVSGTGVQNVTFTGLISSTTYYAHYIHTDASTNDSNVVSSTSFLTDTAPAAIISLPTGGETGHQTGLGTITTDLGEGTLYFLASTNSSELAPAIKAGNTQAITTPGLKNVGFGGLASSTVYYAHYIHTNTDEVDSNIESSTSFTTDAASIGGDGGILRDILKSPLSNILKAPVN
ncbi:MAG: hypothetical protein COB12_12685 [Flavobacterium sp.]|nr:MAG: hypothetical protein COB12_12685 [Flavobacterium sp.]